MFDNFLTNEKSGNQTARNCIGKIS